MGILRFFRRPRPAFFRLTCSCGYSCIHHKSILVLERFEFQSYEAPETIGVVTARTPCPDCKRPFVTTLSPYGAKAALSVGAKWSEDAVVTDAEQVVYQAQRMAKKAQKPVEAEEEKGPLAW